MARTVRLFAVCGSLRRASANRAALEALGLLADQGVAVEIWSGLAALPAFNPDDEEPGAALPPAVAELRRKAEACDGLIVAAPEYAHGVPGGLKNALDWLVGSEAFAGKPTMLVNVAPRAFHAQAQLREILTTMAARIVPEACVIIPLGSRHAGAEAIAGDGSLATKLREGLSGLLAAI